MLRQCWYESSVHGASMPVSVLLVDVMKTQIKIQTQRYVNAPDKRAWMGLGLNISLAIRYRGWGVTLKSLINIKYGQKKICTKSTYQAYR